MTDEQIAQMLTDYLRTYPEVINDADYDHDPTVIDWKRTLLGYEVSVLPEIYLGGPEPTALTVEITQEQIFYWLYLLTKD